MQAIWQNIQSKALRCIDEVYPEFDPSNDEFFPVTNFLIEAATIVARAVPSRALGSGKELPIEGLVPHSDGSGTLPLPPDFLRLLTFKMVGWMRPVVTPIYDQDTRYIQQSNRILRGGEANPVVALCDGNTRLEYYSSSLGPYAEIEKAKYFPMPSLEESYPEGLIDVTAWKVAELTLSSMADASAQIAAQKVNDHISLL